MVVSMAMLVYQRVHPWKLTWNPKLPPFSKESSVDPLATKSLVSMLKYVKFRGCTGKFVSKILLGNFVATGIPPVGHTQRLNGGEKYGNPNPPKMAEAFRCRFYPIRIRLYALRIRDSPNYMPIPIRMGGWVSQKHPFLDTPRSEVGHFFVASSQVVAALQMGVKLWVPASW